jgi:hypothetical protein
MRLSSFAALAIALGAAALGCGERATRTFTIETQAVQTVEACKVRLDQLNRDGGAEPFVTVRVSCGPGAIASGPDWWGTNPPPLAFSLFVGDCLDLQSAIYCLGELESDSEASFVATHRRAPSSDFAIERLR